MSHPTKFSPSKHGQYNLPCLQVRFKISAEVSTGSTIMGGVPDLWWEEWPSVESPTLEPSFETPSLAIICSNIALISLPSFSMSPRNYDRPSSSLASIRSIFYYWWARSFCKRVEIPSTMPDWIALIPLMRSLQLNSSVNELLRRRK